MRILVAEDDAVLAEAVQRSLRQSGHAVDWVQNGAQAEDAVQVENFDLLILDLGLPKKSGLDVLKRLRARDSRLPVLILTASDGVSDRSSSTQRSCSDSRSASDISTGAVRASTRSAQRPSSYGLMVGSSSVSASRNRT